MTKYLIAFIVAGVLLTSAFLFGSSQSVGPSTTSSNNVSASILALSEKSFNFGEISMRDGTVSHTFALTNTGTLPVAIESISTSCMCTEAFLIEGDARTGPFGMPGHGGKTKISAKIPAGESREIEVVFDPGAHGPAGIGRISRAVFIEGVTGKVETIEISATVTP